MHKWRDVFELSAMDGEDECKVKPMQASAFMDHLEKVVGFMIAGHHIWFEAH